ncbi:uncharacterized protein FRV6_11619 [Fusarium oxysporum]|uniref:Uncharacterized protein n=1 Tax=Fusarium oxysporum TaxID=5507 RepID=A0A2H3TFQ2_FUSOX|nr:uncharacterized protein FRV6_11619 [Fusarium oxysporum]
MPHLRQAVPSLREQSTLAISHGISRAADALLHAYFCQDLAYWEMLLALADRGSNPSNVDKRRRKYQDRRRRAMLPEDDTFGTTSSEHSSISSSLKPLGTLPNSWCGISNEVIEIFGRLLALYRSACDYNQDQTTIGLKIASKALCDIAVARELEIELLSVDFKTIVLLEEPQDFYVDTRDDNTPVSHLLETAEAYRKAGLLQLYLTFDDLLVNASGGQNASASSFDDAKDKASRAKSLIDLTL